MPKHSQGPRFHLHYCSKINKYQRVREILNWKKNTEIPKMMIKLKPHTDTSNIKGLVHKRDRLVQPITFIHSFLQFRKLRKHVPYSITMVSDRDIRL